MSEGDDDGDNDENYDNSNDDHGVVAVAKLVLLVNNDSADG